MSTSTAETVNLLKIGYCPLEEVTSFAVSCMGKAIDPYQEKCLDSGLAQQLESVYKQLYRQKHIAHMPLFYKEYGRVQLAGELIGSVKPGPNSRSSSVIAAYWPGSGDTLQNIDYSRMRVGIVQFFVRHTLKLYDTSAIGNTTQEYDHLFAYVHWKKLHPKASWYGISATISSELFEIPGACAFIPVQRIACRCAYATLNIKFSPAHHESVFISCPLPLTHCL